MRWNCRILVKKKSVCCLLFTFFLLFSLSLSFFPLFYSFLLCFVSFIKPSYILKTSILENFVYKNIYITYLINLICKIDLMFISGNHQAGVLFLLIKDMVQRPNTFWLYSVETWLLSIHFLLKLLKILIYVIFGVHFISLSHLY